MVATGQRRRQLADKYVKINRHKKKKRTIFKSKHINCSIIRLKMKRQRERGQSAKQALVGWELSGRKFRDSEMSAAERAKPPMAPNCVMPI